MQAMSAPVAGNVQTPLAADKPLPVLQCILIWITLSSVLWALMVFAFFAPVHF